MKSFKLHINSLKGDGDFKIEPTKEIDSKASNFVEKKQAIERADQFLKEFSSVNINKLTEKFAVIKNLQYWFPSSPPINQRITKIKKIIENVKHFKES